MLRFPYVVLVHEDVGHCRWGHILLLFYVFALMIYALLVSHFFFHFCVVSESRWWVVCRLILVHLLEYIDCIIVLRLRVGMHCANLRVYL